MESARVTLLNVNVSRIGFTKPLRIVRPPLMFTDMEESMPCFQIQFHR